MERQTLSNKQYIFGLIYWPFQTLLLPIIIVYSMYALGIQPNDIAANFAYMAINFTVTTCLFFRVLRDDFLQVKQHPGRFFKYFGIGFGKYYGASAVISVLTMALFPEYSNLNDANVGQMLNYQPIAMIIQIVFLAPVSEELLYRGVFYGFIRKKSKLAAYIVSSAVFSVMHLISYITVADLPTLIISFIQYLPASVALAYSYEKSGTLLCPIMIHIVVNLMATMAMVMR